MLTVRARAPPTHPPRPGPLIPGRTRPAEKSRQDCNNARSPRACLVHYPGLAASAPHDSATSATPGIPRRQNAVQRRAQRESGWACGPCTILAYGKATAAERGCAVSGREDILCQLFSEPAPSRPACAGHPCRPRRETGSPPGTGVTSRAIMPGCPCGSPVPPDGAEHQAHLFAVDMTSPGVIQAAAPSDRRGRVSTRSS